MRSPEKVRFLKEEPGWPSGKICEKKIKYATKDVPRFRHQKSGRTVFLKRPVTPSALNNPCYGQPARSRANGKTGRTS